ncbi:MAG: GTPase HflX [Conexivisphaerales archaeon]
MDTAIVTYKDESYINEAKSLALSAGYTPSKLILVNRFHTGKYGISEGKAEVLKEYCRSNNVQLVIVDEKLNTQSLYELSKYCDCTVIDREKLILEIFALRARTEEAKLQVKLAELSYELPRIKDYVRLQKMGEQPGFFGYGAYETEKYYQNIKHRMNVIQEKLAKIRRRRDLYRSHRRKLGLPVVSLAGYTSAGKTTLFNVLTKSQLETSSSLFTTLTTTTRKMSIDSLDLLVSDTVGFINRLPHYMIEAFKSTLEEISYADLVLLVLDVSDQLIDFKRKFDTCKRTLEDLNVLDQKIITVMNKIDRITNDELERKRKIVENDVNNVLPISALDGKGVRELQVYIGNLLNNKEPVTV